MFDVVPSALSAECLMPLCLLRLPLPPTHTHITQDTRTVSAVHCSNACDTSRDAATGVRTSDWIHSGVRATEDGHRWCFLR